MTIKTITNDAQRAAAPNVPNSDHNHERARSQDLTQPDSHGHHHLGRQRQDAKILVLRPHSGVSGDMLVTGLARLAELGQAELDVLLERLNLDHLKGQVRLARRESDHILGWGLDLQLPPEDEHRQLADIRRFFAAADLTPQARALTLAAFELLAEAEGVVHNLDPEEVHFHEVGALDSLLDMGLAAMIFDLLSPDLFVCGPLPLCDGVISAAHGLLASPAPAVAHLLKGARVKGLDSHGETVTPTALSLLKTFGAIYGPWPEMTVVGQALVFGGRTLPGVPNGAQFAWGWGSRAEDKAASSL
ncbi:MAG: LarC family nickel insertion protein [Deltaproteobacteria bacterium]|jgi:uncharacterized protein (DUF111 family)|nr:LarC family nickel insertion protein [Deltaproteobacteria bacterium]